MEHPAWAVLVPDELFATVELTPIITEAQTQSELPAEYAQARLDLASLMELRWNGTLNGVPLTDDDLTALADAKSAVIRLHGTWVRVDSPAVKRLNNPTAISTATALAAALGTPLRIDGEEHTVKVEGPLAHLGERLRDLDAERTRPAPESMEVDLRPYQERGLAWLGEMDQLGLAAFWPTTWALVKPCSFLRGTLKDKKTTHHRLLSFAPLR